MSIRNKFAFSLAAVLAAVSLTACSGNTSSSSSSAADSSADSSAADSSAAESAATAENSDSADSAADAETAYSPENPVTVKIGLTGNVYEDIWNLSRRSSLPRESTLSMSSSQASTFRTTRSTAARST